MTGLDGNQSFCHYTEEKDVKHYDCQFVVKTMGH